MASPKNNTDVADLVTIAEQIAASKDGDKKLFKVANDAKKWATILTSEDTTDTLGDFADSANDVASVLFSFAEKVGPTASYQWDEAQVKAKLAIVEGQAVLGRLGEDDLEVLATLRPILSDYGKSPVGSRAPKAAAEVIEGRPERVITTGHGMKASNRCGNTKGSESNVPNAAVDHAKAEGIEVDAASLKSDAMQVIQGYQSEVTSQGFTFTAA